MLRIQICKNWYTDNDTVATIIIWQPLLMSSGDVCKYLTAMIGTIVFGIGVDDAIHVMHRIQKKVKPLLECHELLKALDRQSSKRLLPL